MDEKLVDAGEGSGSDAKMKPDWTKENIKLWKIIS